MQTPIGLNQSRIVLKQDSTLIGVIEMNLSSRLVAGIRGRRSHWRRANRARTGGFLQHVRKIRSPTVGVKPNKLHCYRTVFLNNSDPGS
jgi:hypothetical protein